MEDREAHGQPTGTKLYLIRETKDTAKLDDLRLGHQRRSGVQDRVAHLAAVRLDRLVPQLRHDPKYT